MKKSVIAIVIGILSLMFGCSKAEPAKKMSAPQPHAQYVSIEGVSKLLPAISCCSGAYTKVNTKAYLDPAGTVEDEMKLPWATIPLIDTLPNGMTKSLWEVEVNGVKRYKVVYFRNKDLTGDVRKTGWMEAEYQYEIEPYSDDTDYTIPYITIEATSLAPQLVHPISVTFDASTGEIVR